MEKKNLTKNINNNACTDKNISCHLNSEIIKGEYSIAKLELKQNLKLNLNIPYKMLLTYY